MSSRLAFGIGAAALASLLGPLATASASTTGTGTTNAVLSAGALSVTGVASATNLTGTVAGSATGTVPAVTVADTTGSGSGWNVTAGVSDLTLTGTWAAQGSSPVLTTNTSVAFTDTVDGAEYTVTTGTLTSGAGTYTWTSTDTTDSGGGSGTAVASTNNAVGTKGITINFGTQAITSGSSYKIKVGTQSASAMSVNTALGSVTTTSGNTAPTLQNNNITITGGGVSNTSYSASPVKIASAALNTGMGTYVITPGMSVSTDANSWAATYTAGLQYSIVSGP